MIPEQRYLFLVKIRGIGSVKRVAETKWRAIDLAYMDYGELVVNRQLYTAKKLKM